MTPKGEPFFSVLIPSYNRPEFIGLAVGSVLDSTFDDLELVVSDDCSPRQGEIRGVLQPYEADQRLRFVPQAENLGEPRNRAFLADAARGAWLLTLSDDDLLFPHALRTIRDAISDGDGAELLTFGYRLIDEAGRLRYSRRAPSAIRIHRDNEAVLPQFLYSRAFPYWFYQPATFCMHRSVRSWVQPDPEIGMGDDMKFLFDYVDRGGTIYVIPEVLMSYRKISPPPLRGGACRAGSRPRTRPPRPGARPARPRRPAAPGRTRSGRRPAPSRPAPYPAW